MSEIVSTSCGPGCGCVVPPLVARRDFLAISGLTLASAALAGPRAMAGPFTPTDFERLIPPDKKLAASWVRSLTARGEPAVYTKDRDELKFIGMPVGGICTGTLYLGGDGKLWLWDIFNTNKEGIAQRQIRWSGFGHPHDIGPRDGSAYVQPPTEHSPLEQGFAVRVGGVVRTLDNQGWAHIAFTGQYPVGTVAYSDPASPVAVTLTAYSPFIPLNADDSGLPATICEFRVHNKSSAALTADIGGWLENAASLYSAGPGSGTRINTAASTPEATVLSCRFVPGPTDGPVTLRKPDISLSDFPVGNYGTWRVEGTAFGQGPIARADVPGYQGDLGGTGAHLINSHASAPGASVAEKDQQTGTLTSPPFVIDRKFLSFFIGGGSNVDEVGLRVMIDGKPVRRAAGHDNNHMIRAALDLTEFAGKMATLEIYDHATGPWGNVGVSDIVLTDTPQTEPPTAKDHDFGTLSLALLGSGAARAAVADPVHLFDAAPAAEARKPVGQRLIGGVTTSLTLAPGEEKTAVFVVAWHFPNSGLRVVDAASGNYYAAKFADAAAVADHVSKEYPRLSRETKLWHETWYDSTLPHWFLDRTFANTSILATTTAHRFATGRFWGWEGIGCCEGTCTHVWHYAQAVGRIFPEIERHHREFVDFGAAFNPANGEIGYRGEHTGPAVDGQCGRILGVLREHQMSPDDAFLKRVWPRVRGGLEFLIHHDSDGDGLLDGAQENTLDAAWYGKIAWISSLYAAALLAGAEMAKTVGDAAFAETCATRARLTRAAIEGELFNGEYFIQKPQPGKEGTLGTYETCHIDQVHGQSWAWQVGLGRVLDREKTVSALRSLYRYNFTPDVGPFRTRNTAGRPYALEGDGGLIMSTNPKELPHAFGDAAAWQFGYFNECMSGFEHQAASHMIAEGMVQEGLAVTRAIHDRYHPSRRNPYNEIECSDHYSRSMASYGSFVTICGFEYDGPTGHMGFAPRVTPDDFRAAFTAADGWGTFAQKRRGKALAATVQVKHGTLRLKTLALTGDFPHATATVGGIRIPATVAVTAGRTTVTLAEEANLVPGHTLEVVAG
jgi:non-lysosomal glucosylceramidase